MSESPPGRLLLRTWLEQCIEQGDIPGLSWVDRNQRVFKVPWYHYNNSEWRPEYFSVFKEWALYKGKYVEGDPPNYAKWKTNFRCALNKTDDIQEVTVGYTARLDHQGNYKIYQFIDKNHKYSPTRTGACNNNHSPSTTDQDYEPVPLNFNDAAAVVDKNIIQEKHIFSDLGEHIEKRVSSSVNCAIPTCIQIKKEELVDDSGDNEYTDSLLECERKRSISQSSLDVDSPASKKNSLVIDKDSLIESCSPDSMTDETVSCLHLNYFQSVPTSGVIIEIFYSNTLVRKIHTTNKNGCHISFGMSKLDNLNEEMTNKIYGKCYNDMEKVYLPTWPDGLGNGLADHNASQILEHCKRGFIIQPSGGNIDLIRLCKTILFYNRPDAPSLLKVPRNDDQIKTTIFDFENHFMAAYAEKKKSKSDTVLKSHVNLILGQKCTVDNLDNVLIKAKITSCTAQTLLNLDNHDVHGSVEISHSGEFDY